MAIVSLPLTPADKDGNDAGDQFWIGWIFFISYFFFGMLLVLNIIMGALIEFISTYLSIIEEEAIANEDARQASTLVSVAKLMGDSKKYK